MNLKYKSLSGNRGVFLEIEGFQIAICILRERNNPLSLPGTISSFDIFKTIIEVELWENSPIFNNLQCSGYS